jgi:hypothetical protein
VARRRRGSCWRSVNATVSSVISCAPSSRVHHLPPAVSATVKPYGSRRALRISPATDAAAGLPPASTTPAAANWAPPAKTSTDMVTGTQGAGRRTR